MSDLQFTNIEETINTLMEATTVRLVLVNTPESGEYARFDIRPLQEFFAAEFIYEDISAEHLGERLATIGGDSHWREVMHFLLSALIENSRRTDLAVAVEKLALLNERVDGSSARLFYRRLAAGGVIAARLLAEGVLDQDRRVRQQFKRCLEPLFGCTDGGVIKTLATVKGDDSISWLIDVLADTLSEQSESESIGAAFILCMLLPDHHNRQQEIESGIHSKSPEYRACLFRMMASLRDELSGRTPTSNWVPRLAFRSLISSEWARLKRNGIRAAFDLIATREDRIVTAAVEAGLEQKFAQFCGPLIFSPEHPKADHVENWCNIIRATFHAPDARLDPSAWDDDLRRSVANAPGIFSLVQPTFAVASGSRLPAALTTLLAAGSVLQALPTPWLGYLPRQFREQRSTDHSETGGLLTPIDYSWEHKPGYVLELDLVPGKGANFVELLKSAPDLALSLVVYSLNSGGEKALGEIIAANETAQQIGELCLAHPHVLSDTPQVWGRLVELCERFVPIRDAILAAASGWESEQHYFGPIHPFIINLPNEASLLPPVLDCLLSVGLPVRYRRDQPATLAKLILAYFPTINPLLSLMAEAQTPEHRGAAALTCLLHSACPKEQHADCITSIVKNYTPHKNSWYLRAAAVALEPLIVGHEMVAIEAMGTLLRAGSADFDARLGLNFAFERLRQRSNAPVTQFGITKF